MSKLRYKTHKELNSKYHPYTGTITCYYGRAPKNFSSKYDAFIQINDCHNSIRLHPESLKTKKDRTSYYNKVKQLRKEIHRYEKWLERNI